MTDRLVLFLDFDGVLHPEGVGAELEFCHLGTFEQLMREFPQVLIVVSSTWRLEVSWDRLKQHFSPDIQPRLVGVTPSLSELQGVRGQRQRECEAWLRQHANESPNTSVHWLALDDRESYFDEGCENLVLLPHVHAGGTGLEGEYVELLRCRLRWALGREGGPDADSAWNNMPPVGWEFGSTDYERLMQEASEKQQDRVTSSEMSVRSLKGMFVPPAGVKVSIEDMKPWRTGDRKKEKDDGND